MLSNILARVNFLRDWDLVGSIRGVGNLALAAVAFSDDLEAVVCQEVSGSISDKSKCYVIL